MSVRPMEWGGPRQHQCPMQEGEGPCQHQCPVSGHRGAIWVGIIGKTLIKRLLDTPLQKQNQLYACACGLCPSEVPRGFRSVPHWQHLRAPGAGHCPNILSRPRLLQGPPAQKTSTRIILSGITVRMFESRSEQCQSRRENTSSYCNHELIQPDNKARLGDRTVREG